jgi:hypothetical protein
VQVNHTVGAPHPQQGVSVPACYAKAHLRTIVGEATGRDWLLQ